MFYQIFFSPQVKRSGIISNKHGITELPHELPNDLRLKKLGNLKLSNLKISGKSQNFTNYCLVLSPPPEMKVL